MSNAWYNYEAAEAAQKTPRPKRGKRWIAIVVIIVVLAAAGVGIWWYLNNKGANAPQSSLVDTVAPTSTDMPQSTDKDGDNLSDQDEARYGTNPEERDTDKDGFDDGTEVANGYNPNGAGQLNVPPPEKPVDTTQTSAEAPATISGVAMSQVFSGRGSYTCRVTGGSPSNTVTVKVKDGKVRQETPIKGSTLVFIVDGTRFFMSGFADGKYMEMQFDKGTNTASGNGGSVKGGIFVSEQSIRASGPDTVACEEANWPESDFAVAADKILVPSVQ